MVLVGTVDRGTHSGVDIQSADTLEASNSDPNASSSPFVVVTIGGEITRPLNRSSRFEPNASRLAISYNFFLVAPHEWVHGIPDAECVRRCFDPAVAACRRAAEEGNEGAEMEVVIPSADRGFSCPPPPAATISLRLRYEPPTGVGGEWNLMI